MAHGIYPNAFSPEPQQSHARGQSGGRGLHRAAARADRIPVEIMRMARRLRFRGRYNIGQKPPLRPKHVWSIRICDPTKAATTVYFSPDVTYLTPAESIADDTAGVADRLSMRQCRLANLTA
jgi:hypothetical protein